MSTTNNTLPNKLDLSGAAQALAAGLPDPSVLTALANQFIQASQKQAPADIPNANISGLSLPGNISPNGAYPQPLVPVNNRNLSEADLHTIASIAGSDVPKPAVITPQTPFSFSPGIPGSVSAGDFSNVPSFSFLEDARSLFATKIIAPEQFSTAKLPTETETRGSTPTFPNQAQPTIPAVPLGAVGSPQIPGTVSRNGDIGKPSAFSFLETSRPVAPIEVSPTLFPAGNETDNVPKQTNLSYGLFDVNTIRRDFPILQEIVNGKKLIWLDNAATTQKPQSVIDRLTYFYEHENSNVHRAAHALAARSSDAYDAAREKVRRFINAGSVKEIVFVRGTTEGINLVAKSWGDQNIKEGDEILITHLEHHANIVPWQQLCSVKKAKLRVVPVDSDGQVLLDEYEKLLSHKTKLVAFTQVSNALGTVTPVQEMIAMAHRYGAKVLLDGAQSVSHMAVDVQLYDCDFFVFSGHKVFAPTGIGVVYGKEAILNATQPWQGGGNMIVDVTFEKTIYHPAPFRFEAGTASIADAVGLGAAIDYVERIGMANISRYEHELLVYATDALKTIPGLHLVGTAKEKASVLSFVLDGFSNDEVGQALSRQGIAVRTGHHCAQPILRRFGLESSVRPSLAFYNTCEEIDALVATIWNLKNGRSGGII